MIRCKIAQGHEILLLLFITTHNNKQQHPNSHSIPSQIIALPLLLFKSHNNIHVTTPETIPPSLITRSTESPVDPLTSSCIPC